MRIIFVALAYLGVACAHQVGRSRAETRKYLEDQMEELRQRASATFLRMHGMDPEERAPIEKKLIEDTQALHNLIDELDPDYGDMNIPMGGTFKQADDKPIVTFLEIPDL